MSGENLLVLAGAPSLSAWRRHAYAPALLRLASELAATAGPGEALQVVIEHDGWCPALRGGVCCCEPLVHVRGDPRDT